MENENSGSCVHIGLGSPSALNLMKRYDSVCTICGARDLLPFGQRTDGIRVLRCAVCGHGIVEHFQDNVQSLYEDEYFSAVPDSAIGYEDYAAGAEQGVAWAASLLRILKPGGQVLDIGCADGRALQLLGEGYDCFGIELNDSMAQQATQAGVRMIARDLLDSSVEQRYAGCFDAVLSIAVFEHIPDFKEAFRTATALLKPDGILIFEVPAVQFAGDVWYRSSLEHIHYPTESSIEYLFREILHLPLTGSVIDVQDFGGTYIGVTSPDAETARRAGYEYLRLTTSDPALLHGDEARFRWYLDLMHAAHSRPEILALYRHLKPEDWTAPSLHRLFELWAYREDKLTRIIEAQPREVELKTRQFAELMTTRQQELEDFARAKNWLEEQVRNWQQVAGQRQETLVAYEAAKAWLEGQVQNWQQVAGQRQEALAAYEAGMARLEAEARSWQQTSEVQRLRIAELESGKLALEGQLEDLARLEQELSRWQQIAGEAQGSLARLEGRVDYLRAELEYWHQTAEERARWIAELEKAKTWLAQQVDNWEAAAGQRSERIAVLEETIARMRATRAWRAAEWSVGVLRRISGIFRGIMLVASPRLVSSNAKNFLLGLRLVFGGGEGRAIWGAHFDADYYNWAHPDVARSGIHPGLHYLLCGYFENRNPSWSFDSVYYRSRYSDVRDAGINPLMHYAVFGHREERSMAPPLKPAAANLPSPAPLVAQPHRAPFATETAPPLEDLEDSEALLAGTGAALIERLEVPESPRDTGSPGNDTQHTLVMGHEFKPDFSNTPVSELRPRFGYAPADPGAPPAVSLVTPFFNVGSIFNETAESVFRQSLQQWEWIIVDDCSDSPESAAILRVYANKDPRVRVLRSERRNGPAAARNLGVQAARATYVAFLDGDDLLEPTALEKWLWFLDCHPQHGMVKGFQAGFGTQGYIWREGFHSGAAILERNLIQTACMMRREIYLSVGGMDEKIRGGMEDWEFWLRCADAGHWGGTVPEVLDWYRRRASHNDRWEDWDDADRQAAFRDELRSRHPRLFAGGFPEPALSFPQPYIELPAQLKFENRLSRCPGTQRVLMIVPHLALGGSDQVTLDVISALVAKHDCEVTVATTLPGTHAWRHRFEALTPDVFTLDTFLRLRDYPRFLAYLIRSRNIDSVLVTHSQMGYQLLPYLRAECPGLRCYDYVHIEEPHWKQGGYPAYSIAYRSFLDRTAASSRHLKDWMIGRGGDADKISVVTTNVDIEYWRRDQFDASALRRTWDVPEALPVILFVGRLCEQKQPHVLAATVRALHGRGVRFICLVAGDGEQRPWLERFVSQHQLTEVRLVGSRSLEEIRELLALSDIFFLPSRHEGISQALYEAMAMEAVPVGADVGGQKELVPPSCGILIPPGGDEAANYADALASLLTDGRRRAAMAKAARERVVAHFQLPDMGRKMNEILRGQRDTSVFDLDRAFRTFVPTHAREIIEQRRAESIADQCWLQHRGLALAPPAALDTAAALDTPDAPGSRRPDGFAHSALRVLAILHPLFAGKAHRRNRKVLLQILGRPRSRRELLAAFDRDFYCCTNSDIPQISPLPLLHYIFFGYREGRLPSPDFESEMFLRAHPDPSAGKTNPLLWKVLLRGQKHAAQQTEE